MEYWSIGVLEEFEDSCSSRKDLLMSGLWKGASSYHSYSVRALVLPPPVTHVSILNNVY
jgi:hypothetical protein